MSYAAEHRLRLLTLLKRFNVNPSLPHLTTTETRKKALRQAYYQLAKQAHPDAAPDHLRDRAERNFIALHKQYEEARDLLDSVNLEEHAAGSGGPDPTRANTNTSNPFSRQTSSARAGGNRPFEDFWRYEHVDEGAYHSDANEHARRYAFYRRGAAAGSADGAQHYYWAERDPQYLPSTKIGVKDKAKGIFLTAGIALGFFLGSRAGNKRPDYYQQGVEGERPVGLTKYDSTKGGTWVDSVTGEALDARVLRSHWLEQSWSSSTGSSSFTGPLSDGSAPLQTSAEAAVVTPSPESSYGETQFSQEQEPSKAESLEVYLKPTLLRLADFGLDLAGPMRDVYDRRDYFRGTRMFRRTRSDPLVVLEEEQEFIFCPEEGFRPRVPLPGGWQEGRTSSGFSAEAGTSKSTSSTSATQGDADHGTKTGEASDGYKESASVGTNEPAMMSAPAGGFRIASATRQADGKERGQTPVSNGEAKVVSRKKSMPVAVQRKPSHSRSLRKKRSLKSSSAAARASENEADEPVVRQMLDEDAVSSSSSPAQKLGGTSGVRLSATEFSSNGGLQDRNRVPGSTRESGSEQIAARDTTASPEQANPAVVWCLPAPIAEQATAEPLIIWKQVVAGDDARVAERTSRRSLLSTAKASTDSDSGASSPEPLRRRPAASDRFVRPPRPPASDPRSEVWIITPPWYRGSVPSIASAGGSPEARSTTLEMLPRSKMLPGGLKIYPEYSLKCFGRFLVKVRSSCGPRVRRFLGRQQIFA